MAWQGPLLIPSCIPLGVFLVHVSSLGGISKIPFNDLNYQFISSIMVLLTFWLFQYMFIFNRGSTGVVFSFTNCEITMVCSKPFFALKMWYTFMSCLEFSLVPTFFMIFYFGYQPEKLQACVYFCLYTVVCSLPLLLTIIWNTKSIFLFTGFSVPVMALTLAFMVKTPMFFLHIWLPKAHVEAPVAGSMVLAAILLKLGSFGFLLLGTQVWNSVVLLVFLYLSLSGMVLCALSCIRSNDLKSLIAYSSVVHMGVVTSGVVNGSKTCLMSSLMMIVVHGLCSPMMFTAANSLYSSSHTRAILLNKGLFVSPMMSFTIFFILSANMAVPPSVNLWSEMLFISGLMSMTHMFFPILGISVFLGLVYNLYLYISTIHGKQSMMPNSCKQWVLNLCVGPLWCFLLFLSMNFFSVIYYFSFFFWKKLVVVWS
uniref:NADH-ubiquinone oxidoreductase chain 4 n=1 Tax=Spadella cephaloptera TaxID=52888 RepID=Q5VB14_9BILA|nr:NADH dehydrogenase subunit 4 [Spadella cephaloptera]AAT08479.1 NADH dehydrogenase subunit 4 [Spadella cephaloptera]